MAKVGIIGLGNMGSAIAEVMAFNDQVTVVTDRNQELVEKGLRNIASILDSQIKFQRNRAEKEIAKLEKEGLTLSEDQKERIRTKLRPEIDENYAKRVLSNIVVAKDYGDFSKCDFVIEAAFESVDVKKDILRELDRNLAEDGIICSNTSSLSITQLATFTGRADRCIVSHFFNPPYTLPLVEVVRGLRTSDDTYRRVMEWISSLRNHRSVMQPVTVKEMPGFLVNRILVPMMNEAVYVLDEGGASPEDIDKSMKLGAGMPMGPLELCDMVGLDITLDVMNVLYEEYSDPKYRPSPLLKRMVNAGKLGRKTKEGFFKYP